MVVSELKVSYWVSKIYNALQQRVTSKITPFMLTNYVLNSYNQREMVRHFGVMQSLFIVNEQCKITYKF